MEQRVKAVIDNLNSRGFIGKYFETPEEAAEDILSAISADESVGFGGSVTIDSLGVYDRLLERGNEVFWHWKDRSGRDVRRLALLSDVFLCSANALLESGELLSIDGLGNRVAAMFYGPKRAIIVCGINKLVPDYEAGLERIKTIACPKNARRLSMKTPCAKTNNCHECAASLRMCRVTVRYSYPMPGRETRVYLVNSALGF